MAYTGGALNELNGKMGISDPKRSVPVMQLIRAHQPKSKEALVQLIADHKKPGCPCGVKSCGTVTEFGEWLYESQLRYWTAYRYTLQECIQWEYDLFVVQSLKGNLMEIQALKALKKVFPELKIEEAVGYLDDEMRIDLVVRRIDQCIVGGIQVKPHSFEHMREEVQVMQQSQNRKWGYPVWFLFYDESQDFKNLDAVIEAVTSQLNI